MDIIAEVAPPEPPEIPEPPSNAEDEINALEKSHGVESKPIAEWDDDSNSLESASASLENTADTEDKEIYSRPSGFREGIRDDVWNQAVEDSPDGVVRNPLTGSDMGKDKPWDMGHKPGYEFNKHQQSAAERGIDRSQFLDEHNTPEHYRPELPSSNRSHAGEDKTGSYFGY